MTTLSAATIDTVELTTVLNNFVSDIIEEDSKNVCGIHCLLFDFKWLRENVFRRNGISTTTKISLTHLKRILCSLVQMNEEIKHDVFSKNSIFNFKHYINEENRFLNANQYAKVLNRLSIKLAEMDKCKQILKSDKILNFADVCCAPGGFLDYNALKKKFSARGYGITLPKKQGGLLFNAQRVRICALDVTPIFFSDVLTESSKFPKVNLVMADGADTTTQIQHSNFSIIKEEISLCNNILAQNGSFLLKTFS